MLQLNVKEFLIDFNQKFKTVLIKNKLFGTKDFEVLIDELNFILDHLENNESSLLSFKEHKMDKHGVSEYAVKLLNSGKSYDDIADILCTILNVQINEEEVKDWFANYSSLQLTRTRKKQSNLFDIQERMQEIYQRLNDHLILIEEEPQETYLKARTTKEQVMLEVYKEIRMLTKDAKSVIESLDNQRKIQEFAKLVIETIRNIEPGVARLIIEKLKQDKAMFNALLPPS